MKIVCPVCKGSGKLPVTREPKADGECPTCHGKGEIDKK
jgi:DnaJ-class molecular chaperone